MENNEPIPAASGASGTDASREGTPKSPQVDYVALRATTSWAFIFIWRHSRPKTRIRSRRLPMRSMRFVALGSLLSR